MLFSLCRRASCGGKKKARSDGARVRARELPDFEWLAVGFGVAGFEGAGAAVGDAGRVVAEVAALGARVLGEDDARAGSEVSEHGVVAELAGDVGVEAGGALEDAFPGAGADGDAAYHAAGTMGGSCRDAQRRAAEMRLQAVDERREGERLRELDGAAHAEAGRGAGR